MSNDYKIDRVVEFLREVTDSTGRQVILVTHMFDKFGPEADNIVHVTKVDGKASTGSISYQEGKESEEW